MCTLFQKYIFRNPQSLNHNVLCIFALWSLRACLVLKRLILFTNLIFDQHEIQFVHLCCLNPILDLNVFSQTLQGSETPSKWFASMWSLMAIPAPSFPQTLQILAFLSPLGIRFWLGSIIDFTLRSSSCKSPDTKFGIAILRSIFIWSLGGCAQFASFRGLKTVSFWTEIKLDLSLSKKGLGFIFWGIGSLSFFGSSTCPINPFNWSSSAMARKESRFSWKTFASPQ